MPRKLRILHTEASMGWGGQEIRILRESLGMIQQGHRVSIATPADSMLFKKASASEITCVPAHFRKDSPFSFARIISLLNAERFDILNTHSSSDSWVASIAAKLSSCRPKIIRTRHLSTTIGRGILSRIIYDLLPDAVMTTGEQIRKTMIERNGFDGSKIISIPTGIDIDRFDPEKTYPSLKTDGFSVGMIGVLRSWKGHRFFIEAMAEILSQIPEAVFYIVGDGPIKQKIVDMVDNLPFRNRIILTGHREDIPEVMASLDIIVHPSYANEGIPQSLLQALAMKKPVVASDAGAIKEIVLDQETGFLVEPQRPDLIAARVVKLYNNPGLRIAFGEKGRNLVRKEHSFYRMIENIECLYNKLLHE